MKKWSKFAPRAPFELFTERQANIDKLQLFSALWNGHMRPPWQSDGSWISSKCVVVIEDSHFARSNTCSTSRWNLPPHNRAFIAPKTSPKRCRIISRPRFVCRRHTQVSKSWWNLRRCRSVTQRFLERHGLGPLSSLLACFSKFEEASLILATIYSTSRHREFPLTILLEKVLWDLSMSEQRPRTTQL